MFGLPSIIVLDNMTLFSSITMVDFCKDLGVKNKFLSIVHPQANRHVESTIR